MNLINLLPLSILCEWGVREVCWAEVEDCHGTVFPALFEGEPFFCIGKNAMRLALLKMPRAKFQLRKALVPVSNQRRLAFGFGVNVKNIGYDAQELIQALNFKSLAVANCIEDFQWGTGMQSDKLLGEAQFTAMVEEVLKQI